jgi:hypothetical protein
MAQGEYHLDGGHDGPTGLTPLLGPFPSKWSQEPHLGDVVDPPTRTILVDVALLHPRRPSPPRGPRLLNRSGQLEARAQGTPWRGPPRPARFPTRRVNPSWFERALMRFGSRRSLSLARVKSWLTSTLYCA